MPNNEAKNKMTLAPILFVFINSAYPLQGPPPPPPPSGPVPPGLPIDNYVILFFVVGLAYGVWKIHTINKRSKVLK